MKTTLGIHSLVANVVPLDGAPQQHQQAASIEDGVEDLDDSESFISTVWLLFHSTGPHQSDPPLARALLAVCPGQSWV